ncbi:MAG: hypothetical protein ACK4QW_12965 [Alphaproteobacteria bacterium]
MLAIDIRPCTEADLPAVVDLLLAGTPAADRRPDLLERHARESYFDHPWFDAELPSLVSVGTDGRLSGFVGVTARRMSHRGEPVRVAVPGNFVVRPGPDGRVDAFAAIGLLRRFLTGPQDLSVTDTANDMSRRLWEAAGGAVAAGYSLDWFRPIRPVRALLQVVEAERKAALPQSRLLHLAGRGADLLGAPALARMGRSRRVDHTLEPFDPDFLIDLLERHRAYDLVGLYDRAGLDWLMRRIDEKAEGRVLACHGVTDGKQRMGAFAYLLRRDGFAEVLFSYAREGRFDFVLAAMVEDAAQRGASVLTGSVKPPRLPAYKLQRCFFFANQWTIVHSRRSELSDAFHRGRVLLTALDGEKWTRFGDLFSL